MKETLILVDKNDQVIGVGEKINTHLSGALHRAFSIFIFNSVGQLLLQKRTNTKYHSKGLWSNTCCGHPRPGETIAQASRRRLGEEMGFNSEVREIYEFIYHAELDNGVFEHEYDHVLVGKFDGSPNPNPEEVDAWQWVDLATLKLEMKEHPDSYTYWFKVSLDELCRRIQSVNFDSQMFNSELFVESTRVTSS